MTPTHRSFIHLAALAGLLLAVCPACAGSIELAWDRSTDAAGYRVHWGPNPGNYTGVVDVGGVTSATLSGLPDCTTSYIAVSAYNVVGESGYSNEVDSWPEPSVGMANRTSGMQGEQFTLTFSGANLQPGADMDSDNPGLFLEGVTVTSCNEIEAVATIEPTAPGVRAAQVGQTTITVTNPDSLSANRQFQVVINPARFDINQSDEVTSGRIDGRDTVWLSRRFGSQESDPLYHPDFDLDGNGWVDGSDLAYIAANLGRCWTGSAWSASACQ